MILNMMVCTGRVCIWSTGKANYNDILLRWCAGPLVSIYPHCRGTVRVWVGRPHRWRTWRGRSHHITTFAMMIASRERQGEVPTAPISITNSNIKARFIKSSNRRKCFKVGQTLRRNLKIAWWKTPVARKTWGDTSIMVVKITLERHRISWMSLLLVSISSPNRNLKAMKMTKMRKTA